MWDMLLREVGRLWLGRYPSCKWACLQATIPPFTDCLFSMFDPWDATTGPSHCSRFPPPPSHQTVVVSNLTQNHAYVDFMRVCGRGKGGSAWRCGSFFRREENIRPFGNLLASFQMRIHRLQKVSQCKCASFISKVKVSERATVISRALLSDGQGELTTVGFSVGSCVCWSPPKMMWFWLICGKRTGKINSTRDRCDLDDLAHGVI